MAKIREAYSERGALWEIFKQKAVTQELFNALFRPLFISETSQSNPADRHTLDEDRSTITPNFAPCMSPPSPPAEVRNLSEGVIMDLKGKHVKDAVTALFALKDIVVERQMDTECPAVTSTDFVFPFCPTQCETDIYLTKPYPKFIQSLQDLSKELKADELKANQNPLLQTKVFIRQLLPAERLIIADEKSHVPKKIIGGIGSSVQEEQNNTQVSNAVYKRNQNSASLMREIKDQHPLMVADLVQDSVLVLCSRDPLFLDSIGTQAIEQFRSELRLFPVDFVLAALGRYHVIGVEGGVMREVEFKMDSLWTASQRHLWQEQLQQMDAEIQATRNATAALKALLEQERNAARQAVAAAAAITAERDAIAAERAALAVERAALTAEIARLRGQPPPP